MENKLSNPNQTVFEQIKETDESGNEFWGARKISKILDYAEFRNFIPVIERVISPAGNEERDEFKTKVFVESGYPKTWKENIKVVLNLFVNFFS